MSFEEQLLPILRCQKCHGEFGFERATSDDPAAAEFGVLHCHCGRYPVVDGVPILLDRDVGMFEHTTGASQVTGVAPQRLVELIERGASTEALLECLALPVLPPLLRRMLGWRLSNARLAVSYARWLGRARARASVISRRATLTAVETVDFFYRGDSPLDSAVGDYFNLRFGQPRHIAALSLIQNIRSAAKPVLDIACGCGHLDHYLASRRDPVRVVGMDLNFFHTWIARHWVAPVGQYVCAAADEGLPFADDSFAATYCSDAYHLMPNRRALHEEIERCAPGHFCVLARVGNADVMPNEGLERSISGYLEDIAAADTRVLGEEALVVAYLSRRNPLAEPAAGEAPRRSKWLSFAWNLPAEFRDPGACDWPHAEGRLGLNPIYRCRAPTDGGIDLMFEFPGTWYAYENNGMLAYHLRRARMSENQIGALIEGRVDPTFPELVSRFVLLGLPERFVPPRAEFRRFARRRDGAQPSPHVPLNEARGEE